MMGRDLSLAPCGLVVERVETEAAGLLIVARPALKAAVCPTCGSPSTRIHSTYQRSLADLPAQGRAVRSSVRTGRFRCALPTCDQRIFTERLVATAARRFARRTTRLKGIVLHLGLALGGPREVLPTTAAAPPGHIGAWRAHPVGRGLHDRPQHGAGVVGVHLADLHIYGLVRQSACHQDHTAILGTGHRFAPHCH